MLKILSVSSISCDTDNMLILRYCLFTAVNADIVCFCLNCFNCFSLLDFSASSGYSWSGGVQCNEGAVHAFRGRVPSGLLGHR